MQVFYLVWTIVSIAIFIISGTVTLADYSIEKEKPPKVFVIIIIVSFVIAIFTSWKVCGGV